MNNVTSVKERAAYGGYFAGQNFLLIIVLNFLMLFYTDHVGISAASAGLLFLVARIWDAVNDPIMGMVIDKVNLKSGKFKPWINSVIFLLPLATILLFSSPADSPGGRLLWAWLTYIVWGMIYTVSDIPIFALATVMTPNHDERIRIISTGRLAAGIGGLAGAILITPLKVQVGWTPALIILSLAVMTIMVPVKYKTVERVHYERKTASAGDVLRSLLKNRYLLLIYVIIILTNITNSTSATMVYFVTYNLNNELLIPLISLAAASSFIILPPFLPILIRKLGKRNIFLTLMIFSILSSVVFYFAGYTNLVIVFIFVMFKYIALNLPVIMMAMFTTDCLEYGFKMTGERYEGIVFSVQTFSIKMTLALQGVIGAFALSRSNYLPNEIQSEETLKEIWRMNTLYPLVGQIAAVVLFWLFYTLKEEECIHDQ